MGLFPFIKRGRDAEAAAPETLAPLETESDIAPETSDAPETEGESAPELAVEEDAPLDFDSEFAAPEIGDETPPETDDAPELGDDELEEWSEPLPSIAPPILENGAPIEAENGVLTLEEHLETRGAENIYRAIWKSGDETQIVRLRQANDAAAERLAREAMWRAHWDESGRIAMLPRLVCAFKNDDAFYLATEFPADGPTLSQFFRRSRKLARRRARRDKNNGVYGRDFAVVGPSRGVFGANCKRRGRNLAPKPKCLAKRAKSR